jgi:hypothetical protein
MIFSLEFLDIHISLLAQLPMINMALKWHHINICNKIDVCFLSFNVFFGLVNCDHAQKWFATHSLDDEEE